MLKVRKRQDLIFSKTILKPWPQVIKLIRMTNLNKSFNQLSSGTLSIKANLLLMSIRHGSLLKRIPIPICPIAPTRFKLRTK